MSAVSDPLCRALGDYLDTSQEHGQGHDLGQTKGLDQPRFGLREGRRRISHKDKARRHEVRARRSNERVDIVGIGGERAIEKAARSRQIVGVPPYSATPYLENRDPSIGVRGPFRASSLSGDQLGIQWARQPSDDIVLHVEEIGERLVERSAQR